MFKKFILISFLICLTNCSPPGTAFLGPTFTGVKTGSVYQTTLSYGSGKAMKVVRNSLNPDISQFNELFLSERIKIAKSPKNLVDPIFSTLKTHKIEISDTVIEEPLP